MMLDDLDEWLEEEEAAAAVGKTVRTLRQWRRRGVGPPYTHFGRTIKYRKRSFVEHYRRREIKPNRNRPSRPANPKAASPPKRRADQQESLAK
jgi:hypothetical protein